jgi:outer membrane receptor protein involved in Fe transport
MQFNASLFSLSSNYNFSKNLVEAAVRKNFSVNLRLKPLRFLMDNVSMDIASFYMFSSLPYGEQTLTRISPGLNFALRSAGARMPLGFVLIPTFSFNHLWDNREEDFTDFHYSLSLQKEIGIFTGSVDYTLASRYRAENFWIEGSNRQNLNLNLQLNNLKNYSFLLRFYFNNNLDLENISFTGQWDLLRDLRFSSFLLYYTGEKKFQTLEVFLEKTFKKRIKIQGGYSLALKRFFIKFLTL